jgi:hypothetical protein
MCSDALGLGPWLPLREKPTYETSEHGQYPSASVPMPDDDLLTRKQWNELAEMIRDSPLFPSNFERGRVSAEFTGLADSDAAGILYCKTSFAFAIADYISPRRPGYRPGTFAVQMRPGTERQLETFGDMDWSAVRQAFRQWLVNLHAEVEAPDLWAQLAAKRQALAVPPAADNSPFTSEERRRLEAQLDRILAGVQLSEDQATTVRADLDYLKEALGRSGRRDWGLLVVGTLVNFVLSSALPPDKVSEMWGHFVPILQAISQAAPHLLGP